MIKGRIIAILLFAGVCCFTHNKTFGMFTCCKRQNNSTTTIKPSTPLSKELNGAGFQVLVGGESQSDGLITPNIFTPSVVTPDPALTKNTLTQMPQHFVPVIKHHKCYNELPIALDQNHDEPEILMSQSQEKPSLERFTRQLNIFKDQFKFFTDPIFKERLKEFADQLNDITMQLFTEKLKCNTKKAGYENEYLEDFFWHLSKEIGKQQKTGFFGCTNETITKKIIQDMWAAYKEFFHNFLLTHQQELDVLESQLEKKAQTHNLSEKIHQMSTNIAKFKPIVVHFFWESKRILGAYLALEEKAERIKQKFATLKNLKEYNHTK